MTAAIHTGLPRSLVSERFFFDKYQETTSENMKTHLEKYIREMPCTTCHGARLKPEILSVTVGEKNIWEVCELSCKESLEFFKQLTITDRQKVIAGPIVKEIVARLQFLVNVGLDYLTAFSCSSVTFWWRSPAYSLGNSDWF